MKNNENTRMPITEKDFTPIKRSAASDVVIMQLLDLMIARRIRPGDRLPAENEMAQRIGVGRNTIREAMKVLEVLGYIERRQGDGTYIVESYQMPFQWLLFPLISRIGTSNHVVELRRVLELGITELVIEKATDEDLAEIESHMKKFEAFENIEPFPESSAVANDVEIHVTIAEITENPALVEITRLVMKLFEPSMGAHMRTKKGFREAVESHKDILNAIKKRDKRAARSEVLRSFESWKQFIEV
jgi:GntR family transcriptional repressor for pyruvate dehydrogenase complex